MEENSKNNETAQLGIGAVSGSVKPTSWRGQKCYHCESEKRNTLRDSVNIDGSEDWKCFDCGKWFKL